MTEQTETQAIAIIGIGCRFPGGINSPETFWQLLRDEVDAVTEIPLDRIDIDTYYDPRPATPGKIMTRWGGFLEQIDQFDAYFFGISPREAERLDPQQRLLLEVAWEALEDAGQVIDKLAGSKTGVFVGLWLNDYEARMFADPASTDFYMTTGSGRYSASGRISYNLGLQGPSMTIDTACSSSLVAVHLGCQSLWSGECTLALAGGANVILQPHVSIAYSQSRMMASDGRCKFGDARADGYVRSEGIGLVVLKPLTQAVADGDPIYAIIRGSAVNNDGRSGGYLATPSRQGQEEVLRWAYQNAGVSPSQVQYIEAHGAGTRAGDPVELAALGAVLAADRPPGRPCLVGSVKTNLGHTEGAAGVVGLIKVALSLKHRAVPASLHLQELNPNIPWQELGLAIPTELTPWPADTETVIAGVSSFGIAGTNAHVVLAEAPPPSQAGEIQEGTDKAHLLPLSAHTPKALEAMARAYKTLLTAENAPPLHDTCYAASCRRTHHEERLALVAETHEEMAKHLEAFLQGELHSSLPSGQKESGRQPKVVFVFPGQGSQWLGMGRELLERESVFRQTLERCEEAMRPFVDWSLLEQLTTAEESSTYRLNEIDVIQPTLLSIEIALAALWRSWGIEPDALIGHSMGEVGAAYVAGALSLEDAMRVICRRSKLLRRTSGQGAMAVVELSIEGAQAVLADYEDRLSIAVSNSPRSTVLSGDPAALDKVIETLQGQDIFCRLIKVDVASHSPQMDLLKADLLAALEGLQPRAASVPIYSTPLGVVMDGADYDAAYWVKNLRQPVLFSKMLQQLLADGHNVFIEMSPHPILLPAVQQGFQQAGQDGIALPSLRRNEAEQATILSSLGALYTQGYPVDWDRLYPAGGCHVKLPRYPWQRERFWIEPAATRDSRAHRTRPGGHPLLGQYLQSANGTHFWESELSIESFPYLNDHRVQGTAVLPAAAYIEMALAAAAEAFGAGAPILEKVAFKEVLVLPDAKGQVIQLIMTPDMPGAVTFQFFSRPTEDAEPQAWTLHASGTIRLAQGDTIASLPASVIPKAIRARSQEAMRGAEHYQAMRARGLQYGPSFQAIAQLWQHVQRGEVAGELQCPEAIAPETSAYQLHPVLLDACFQLLVAAVDGDGSSAATETYLPVRLDSLQVYGRPDLDGNLWGYATCQPEAGAFVGDAFLLNGEEQVVVAAHGFHFQRLERDAQAKIDNWLYEIQWQPQPRPEQTLATPDPPGTWLIFADSRRAGQGLASQLEGLDETCVIVFPGASYKNSAPGQYQLNPTQPDEFQQLLKDALTENGEPCRGIVHLWSLMGEPSESTTLESLESAQERGCISVLHLIQALNAVEVTPSPRLWLVTRGAQAVGTQVEPVAVAQSPLWGLGGVIAHEHPELHCTRIDLSPVTDPQENDALLAELWSEGSEDQIALRDGTRYVARLVRYTAKPLADEAGAVTRIEAEPGQAYRLEIPAPGILDNLTLQATTRQEPGPGQIEIEIHATGLNFIDVMRAMGICPGFDPDAPVALGSECAGKIIAIGDSVDGLQVGDKVIAITPSFDKTSLFSAYVTIPAEFVVLKPAHLTCEEAATIPLAFLTAYYAMCHLGRLGKGERVLIHSATGGVGMAAVQLAQLAEAEIFATAGSPEKRAYLRKLGIQHVMDSRSLAFAEEVMAQTSDKGVNMVLNSLTGEAMRKSLSVLGAYGRFLEIGKRDIYQNNQLGLEPFKKNLSFFAIDLARMTAERPSFVMSLLREVIQYLEDGALHPLPVKVFSISEVNDALRYMAQAKHIGKIVVSLRNQKVMLASSATKPAIIRSDSTYLITGGLGGLGLVVTRWLVEQGARHLVLVGRSGASATAQTVLNELQAAGAQVVVIQADVTRTEAVAGMLAQIEQTTPPLRGIIHAAGILDDATLLQLDQEQFKRVTAPKLKGAWNLHILTQNAPLDFFILFSSVTALLGSPGQGNYVAGNAFLDALAHHRRGQGQPALSINWGPWSKVGLAAARSNRGKRLAQRGVASITPEQGVATLARLFRQADVQIGVMPFDWQRWSECNPVAGRSPLFAQLRGVQTDNGSKPQESSIHEVLLAAKPGRQRQSLLESHLREQASQVLRLTPSRIPLNRPLKTLGLDSLMTLELRNRLEASLGLTLSATLIWNYPTIAALVPYLADKMDIPLERVDLRDSEPGAEAEPQSESQVEDGARTDASVELEHLSKDEVETLLTKELSVVDELLKGN